MFVSQNNQLFEDFVSLNKDYVAQHHHVSVLTLNVLVNTTVHGQINSVKPLNVANSWSLF